MHFLEVNFDGLIAPFHNYAGLSFGNIASQHNAKQSSNPKAAALQGLAKMQQLLQLGLVQAVIPPQERPALTFLRQLGYRGHKEHIMRKVLQDSPKLFAACYSASAMWTANTATFSPSIDTHDGKVHMSTANLCTNLHRQIEAEYSYQFLQQVFCNKDHFVVHPPLPNHPDLADEGAANHNRFCEQYHSPAVNLFVYGRCNDTKMSKPAIFPARQTLSASQAIVRRHGLTENKVIYAQQNPAVVDQGVFHNDVISVVNKNVLFYHEHAFVHSEQVISDIEQQLATNLITIKVDSEELPVHLAVQSYLFNSQLLSLNEQDMLLLCPRECAENPTVKKCLDRILNASNPIHAVLFIDLQQSMRNGGGPACLRWRAVLNEQQRANIKGNILLTEKLIGQLQQWVHKYYRDRLTLIDMCSKEYIEEVQTALDELTLLLALPSLYSFQRSPSI